MLLMYASKWFIGNSWSGTHRSLCVYHVLTAHPDNIVGTARTCCIVMWSLRGCPMVQACNHSGWACSRSSSSRGRPSCKASRVPRSPSSSLACTFSTQARTSFPGRGPGQPSSSYKPGTPTSCDPVRRRCKHVTSHWLTTIAWPSYTTHQ